MKQKRKQLYTVQLVFFSVVSRNRKRETIIANPVQMQIVTFFNVAIAWRKVVVMRGAEEKKAALCTRGRRSSRNKKSQSIWNVASESVRAPGPGRDKGERERESCFLVRSSNAKTILFALSDKFNSRKWNKLLTNQIFPFGHSSFFFWFGLMRLRRSQADGWTT